MTPIDIVGLTILAAMALITCVGIVILTAYAMRPVPCAKMQYKMPDDELAEALKEEKNTQEKMLFQYAEGECLISISSSENLFLYNTETNEVFKLKIKNEKKEDI